MAAVDVVRKLVPPRESAGRELGGSRGKGRGEEGGGGKKDSSKKEADFVRGGLLMNFSVEAKVSEVCSWLMAGRIWGGRLTMVSSELAKEGADRDGVTEEYEGTGEGRGGVELEVSRIAAGRCCDFSALISGPVPGSAFTTALSISIFVCPSASEETEAGTRTV